MADHRPAGLEAGHTGQAGKTRSCGQAKGVVLVGGLLYPLEHDPEKWVPVFRKDHAQIKEIERDDDSKKSHHALGAKHRR
jgi:hypothetical protein